MVLIRQVAAGRGGGAQFVCSREIQRAIGSQRSIHVAPGGNDRSIYLQDQFRQRRKGRWRSGDHGDRAERAESQDPGRVDSASLLASAEGDQNQIPSGPPPQIKPPVENPEPTAPFLVDGSKSTKQSIRRIPAHAALHRRVKYRI